MTLADDLDRIERSTPAAMVAAGDASLPAGQKAGLMPSKSNEDIIERSLNSILDSHEKTIERIKTLEANMEEVREHAESAMRSRAPFTATGERDMDASVIPDRFRRTIETHARMGAARPVAAAAAEASLKLLAAAQLPGMNAPRAAEELGKMKSYLNENTGAQGAFAVPSFLEAELYRLIERNGVVRRLSRVQPAQGKQTTLVNLATGVTSYVVAELGTAITAGEPTVGSSVLSVYDYVSYGRITLDALQDEAVGLLDLFFQNSAEAFARDEDRFALQGTAGDPCLGLGSQDTTNVYTVGKIVRIDTTTATNSPTAPSLLQMAKLTSVVPLSANSRPAWVMNPVSFANVIAQVSSAVPVLGNASWFTPSPNPSDSVMRGFLLGFPVYVTDVITGTTEGAKAYFGAFGQHLVFGDRQGVDFRTSLDEHFQSGLVAMRAIKRTAITVANAHAFAMLGKLPYSLA